MKIRLLLSYKGNRFYGWQKQKNKRTVQEVAEQALYRLFGTQIPLVSSGRTDTGVHALGQNAHFQLNENNLKNIPVTKALNSLLPEDVCILESWKAPEEFHARFSAKKKSYLYLIWTGASSPVLFRDLVWWKKSWFSLEKLQKISSLILGEHDFKSFQSAGSSVKSTVRQIYRSQWKTISPSLHSYEIIGSGFLKQMVRNIVGTYMDLLKEKNPKQKLKYILAQKDRKVALGTAPGQGLYLKSVFYPPALDKSCVKI